MTTAANAPKFPAIDPAEQGLFADPRKYTRIEIPALGPGAWIEVRDEVSVGDERAVFSKAVKGTTQTKEGEARMEYDAQAVSFGNTVLHVVDWSLKTTLSPDALKAMKPAAYTAIDEAVKKHIDKVKEGNAPSLPSSSESPTSVSAS